MKRIVITGVGVVTPFGVGLQTFKEGIFAGRNGIKPITRYSDLPVKYAGEVDFDPLQYFGLLSRRYRLICFIEILRSATTSKILAQGCTLR